MARISYTVCKKKKKDKKSTVSAQKFQLFSSQTLYLYKIMVICTDRHVYDRQNLGVSETKGTWSCG